MKRPAILLALPLAVGCITRPAVDAPLKVTRDVSFSVDGGVQRTGLPGLPGVFDPPAFEPADGPPTFEGRVRVVPLDPTTAELVLGAPCYGAEAKIAAEADVNRVLAELEAGANVTPAADSRLVLARGQRGALRIVNEIAYVGSFDLEAVPGAAILDPVVLTEPVGMQVALRGDYADENGPWDVAVELDVAEVNRPIPQVTIRPPGVVGENVQIETPVFGRVGLETSATVAAGDAIVVFVPSPGGDGVLMITITPARASATPPIDAESAGDVELSAKPGTADLPILMRVPTLAERFGRRPER